MVDYTDNAGPSQHTPLLSDHDVEASASGVVVPANPESGNSQPMTMQPKERRALLICSWISLVSAGLTLIFAIVLAVLREGAPRYIYFRWRFQERVFTSIFWVCR
jgi:hypothetical protein